ncbi:hypothetical protein LWI29_037129 [Acer saccharum]|uniref:Pectinesterase n=1 Tax=Acer saccharum TaxID=4024 RepID=A0AA39T8C5_ACESA|nr:hypothetical protein LWI29_037129 [Acer saccharum]
MDFEKFLKEFDVEPKNPSEAAIGRWRSAVSIVKNRRRRFHMRADLDKRSEADQKKLKIQDTLFMQSGKGLFIRDNLLAVVIQNSTIDHVSLPSEGQGNVITAQGRADDKSDTGIVIQNCTIIPTHDLAKKPDIKTYLGRPWKKFSRTIIMESYLNGFIDC